MPERGSGRFGRMDLSLLSMKTAPTVAVTRSEAGTPGCELSARLEEAGVEVVAVPLTHTVPPEDDVPLVEALARIEVFDWLVVTSARTVEPVWDRLTAGALPSARERGLRVCAVGPGTARALEAAGVEVDVLPARFHAEGVVEAILAAGSVDGRQVLFPRAEGGRDVIPDLLAAAGANVEVPVAYRTVPDEDAADRLVQLTLGGALDALTFTAGSAAAAFGAAWARAGREEIDGRIGVFALGPATADALASVGVRTDVIADPHTFAGLAEAASRWVQEAQS